MFTLEEALKKYEEGELTYVELLQYTQQPKKKK